VNIINLEPKDWSRVRRAMQDAIAQQDAPPELAAAISARIRAESGTNSSRGAVRWLMAAAAAVVLATAGIAVHLSTGSGPGSADLARVGLAHHVHCGAVRPLPVPRPDDAALAAAVGPDLGGLVRLVSAHADEGYELVDAHRCRSIGRDYVHLVCRSGSGLVSVMVPARDGELATGTGGTTVLDGISVAALPTRNHVTFVVGTDADVRNLGVSVRDHVAVAES
jgi:hypothetical protein